RDHGPIFIRANATGEVAATDWRYNGWGGKYGACDLDNQILASALPAAQPPWLSVRDFGAKGDGSANDTAAIRKAVAAAVNGNGGIVFFPAGQYVIDDTLVVAGNGVTLLGEGRGSANSRRATGTWLLLKSQKTAQALRFERVSYSGLKSMSLRGGGEVVGGRTTEALVRFADAYHPFMNEIYMDNVVCGVDLENGISPLIEDLDIKNAVGEYGVRLHGSGEVDGKYKKMDAAAIYRIAASAAKGVEVDWVRIGPNVDGAQVYDTRFVGGGRGLRLMPPQKPGDIRPKYIHTFRLGCDHVLKEGALLESGNDVFMTNTWIGQNKGASGIVIGKDFTGVALLANLRVRGSGAHGLHIRGGSNISVMNASIGACGTNRTLIPADAKTAAGILIEKGVRHCRVVGGGVGPVPEQGGGARQHYGILYTGSERQAAEDSVGISGVDTAGNAVPFAPAALLKIGQ
ncbi:MAG: agmatine deiminase family protein, partial [Opitutaceae bacterium]|nr:agmatine deiminase family protein [Opitutaceae bacterium]